MTRRPAGAILALAGVFTISNVIRLTVYARQDELDIMRLVGATQAYVKGPFVVEGLLQGGLGGLVSVALAFLVGVGTWQARVVPAVSGVLAVAALALAVIFIYLILASQFGSFLQPVAIMPGRLAKFGLQVDF